MTEHRWSKFWWADYEGDDALRVVSLAAQGIWMRMLCAMHKGEPYGHLTINGKPPTMRQIAMMASTTEREAKKLLAELGEAGVFSRTDDGVIFSRRMVRDMETHTRGVNDGKRGGNPKLATAPKGGGLTPPDNGGGYALDTEADTEAEKKDLKEDSVAATGEREVVAPSPPTVLPSSVTAVVGQLTARLEGRARGQPFLTPPPPQRTVGEQLAAVTPPKIRARPAPPDVLAEARRALAERAARKNA